MVNVWKTGPPLTVANEGELNAGLGAASPEDLSLLEREDSGELHVMYMGMPLYYFASDEAAGDTTGQARGDVWWVVNPPLLRSRTTDSLGEVLTGRDDTTLYTFANDEMNVSNCDGRCAINWPPLLAASEVDLESMGDMMMDGVSIIERSDNTMQVAYNGQPLYYFIRDGVPGDVNGHERGDNWFVVALDMEMMDGDMTDDEMMAACTVTAGSNVNLRTGPGTNYAIAGSLTTDMNPAVVGQAIGSDNFVWWNLDSGAWVRSDIVTEDGDCESSPIVNAPAPPPTIEPQAAIPEPETTQEP